MKSAIIEKVISILKELSGAEKITVESDLKNDATLNSLQMIVLLLDIEREFNIILNEEDLDPYKLVTVCDIVDLVERYVGEANEE